MDHSDSTNIFSGYFNEVIFLLKISGMWIPDDNTRPLIRFLYIICNCWWFVYLYILYLPAEILMMSSSGDGLANSIRSSRDVTSHLLIFAKVIVWYQKRKDILGLMNKLQNTGFEYEKCDDFNPRKIANFYRKDSWIYLRGFIRVLSCLCSSIVIGSLLFFALDYQLLYKPRWPAVYPFPIRNETSSYYAFSVLWTVTPLVAYAAPILAVDALYIKTLSCSSAHFMVIAGAFTTLRARCIKMLQKKGIYSIEDQSRIHTAMNMEMKKCIRHIQFTYSMFEKLESIFSAQIAVQIFLAWTNICFCLYLMSSADFDTASGDFLYMCTVLLQLFIYCRFGDQVTEASIKVRSSLYESEWTNADKTYRTAVIITMMRLYKPVYMTVGKLCPLTLEYFLTVVRSGYSLFTFLQNKSAVAETK